MASLASLHAAAASARGVRSAVSNRRGATRASLKGLASASQQRRRHPLPPAARLSACVRGRRRSFAGLVVARAVDDDAPAAEAPAAPDAASGDAAKIAEMVSEIKDYLKLLYVKREMNFNEVRLTLAIEDPRLADRRERYGIEDESGVSADEKVAALEAIDAGETPDDLLALEMLLADFRDWPGLEDDVAAEARRSAGPSRYAEIANQAAGIRGAVPGQRTGGVEEKEEEEMDGNPFGFLVLYGVSAVPIFITIAALSIMFVNSLQ